VKGEKKALPKQISSTKLRSISGPDEKKKKPEIKEESTIRDAFVVRRKRRRED